MRRIAMLACALAFAACEPAETETDAESAAELSADTEGGVLAVQSLPGGGDFLTAADGRALYTLEGTDDPGACVDACATAWPPYTSPAAETPTAGGPAAPGLQPGLIATVRRPDGTTQVTYGGHPLYFYARDTGPGETTGQDVTDEWGEWYLVQPSGDLQEGGGTESANSEGATDRPADASAREAQDNAGDAEGAAGAGQSGTRRPGY